MSSLNQEVEAANVAATATAAAAALEDTNDAENPGVPGGRAISRRGEEARGGFVLRAKSDETPHRRRSLVERSGMKNFVQGLKLKKQRSTGDLDRKGVNPVTSIRSTGSNTSWMSSESGFTAGGQSMMSEGSNQSFALEDEQLDASVTETYMGEWKNDKRCGFGISERSDGLKYEGEWYNNRKYGYGITTHGGVREEGKYKNNVLVTSNQKRHLFLVRSAKFRERIDSALNAAQRASKIALQKADIAISRTATARGKAEQADIAAIHAREDSQMSVGVSQEFGTAPVSDQVAAVNAAFGLGNSAATGHKADVIDHAGLSGNGIASNPGVSGNNLLNVKNNHISSAATPAASSNRPRTPEVVIHAPMEKLKSTNATQNNAKPSPAAPPTASAASATRGPAQPVAPPVTAAAAAAAAQPALSQLRAQMTAAPAVKPSGPSGTPLPPSAQPPPAAAPSSNVMQPRRSMGQPQQPPSLASGGQPSTNCDISNTTESNSHAMFQQIPNHRPMQQQQPQSQPQAPMQAQPRGRSSAVMQQSIYQDSTNVNPVQQQGGRQPPPPLQPLGSMPNPWPIDGTGDFLTGAGAGPAGGYNFGRIADDHLEHYKRPASREQSVDKSNLPQLVLASEAVSRPPNIPTRGRSGSRQPRGQALAGQTAAGVHPDAPMSSSRPPSAASGSRHRTPLPLGTSHTDMELELNRKELEAKFSAQTGNGDLIPEADPGLRFRGQPSQEISQLGTIPKRTESLYLKQSLDPKAGKDTPAGTLQRKKSLPDVQALDVTTKSQGSKAMTREEISVLSSARRETVRRQLEETEAYRNNPLLYLFNPRITEWISRQKLMLLILFINLSLAIMFFKLLT